MTADDLLTTSDLRAALSEFEARAEEAGIEGKEAAKVKRARERERERERGVLFSPLFRLSLQNAHLPFSSLFSPLPSLSSPPSPAPPSHAQAHGPARGLPG